MKNAEWIIKNGHRFYDIDCDDLEGEGVYYIFVEGTFIDTIKTDDSPLGAMLKWLDMEHETILDDAEKKYLSAVIAPFRDRVEYIVKSSSRCKHGFCRIRVCFHDSNDDIYLPFFNEMAMYKGVKMDKAYTLEELGL